MSSLFIASQFHSSSSNIIRPNPNRTIVVVRSTMRACGTRAMKLAGATGGRHVALPRQQRQSLLRVRASEGEEGKVEEKVEGEAKVETTTTVEDEPVWVKREKQRELDSQNKDLPFGVYLLFSCIVTIAAVGSCFEFANQNPIFGVVGPDSPLYAPVLGLFAVTGIPTAGLLFFKGVTAANAEAERMDAMDGVASRDSVLNPKNRGS